jgi:carbonic anhydrase
MNVKDLENAQKQFKESRVNENKEYFQHLSKGQQPTFFVLACCDSRTDPSTVTGQPLGELFIHRNIANQAPSEDSGFQASLFYALHVLKVDYVLVLGHTFCGGVQGTKQTGHPDSLERWLKYVRESVDSCEKGTTAEDGETLERHNVKVQIENIKKADTYTELDREVPVLGALFHIENGNLEWIE